MFISILKATFLCLCVQQHRQCEGDASDLARSQHPDRPVGVHAADSSAVDPKARPLRPLPLHRSHFA